MTRPDITSEHHPSRDVQALVTLCFANRYTSTVKLKVVVEQGEQSGYVVHVPALPGCWSQGATREEALINVREAVEGWIEAQQDRADRLD